MISSEKPFFRTNVSNVIVNGIVTAPTKRSAMVTLYSRMFEFFFSSLLVLTAIIIKRFNRMVVGQAMVVMATITFKKK